MNSVPHSRTKWPPRRFIETAGKTNPLSSPSAPSLAFRVYAPTLPSIRISASPGRPLHPLRRSLRPTPDLPSTSNLPVPNVFAISPPSPPSSRSPCSQSDHRNPQEFHFVCQPNYTPQFYTFPRVPSFFPLLSPILSLPLYSRIFREKRRIRSSFLPSAGKKF